MEQTLFYVVGIVLVLAALTVSALGLRNRSFPPSRRALAAGVALFVVLVGATAAAAVINAREEQQARENELAAEAAEEQEAAEEEQQAEEVGETGPGAAALQLSAPADGSLAFDPETLEASAGEVTIDFQNPAAIEHDVVIEQDGEDIAKSDLVADDENTSVSAELEPGDYVYYCDVPGHREGGMEGTLTVE
jgi:plastocyanin